ncbi:MAG: LPS assembly lipoprotein LptE [Alphaproteobacteria bacterium]|nr:LPS assembly lipoprotein LptE [Alphaproteobacteria bacterium]
MKSKLSLIAFLFLSACGFTPMYGNLSGDSQKTEQVREVLSNIEIGNIPDAEGQYLRNLLIDRFYKEGYPDDARYILSVSPVQESVIDLDITKTSDATRGQMKVTTTMKLTDKTTGKVVLTRGLRSLNSFNILNSEFTNRVSKENTRKNALEDIARQVEQQIALYLNRQK